jgi:hypothetical protein
MVAYKETRSVHAQRRRAYGQLVWSLLAVVVCAGALAIVGCGGDDDDDTRQLSANLTGAQEVPPVNTAAAGTATLRINEEGKQIDFTLIVSTALQDIREAHIHIAPTGANGPIVLDFCTTSLATPPANVPLPPTCPPAPFTLNGSLTAANLRTLTAPQIQTTGVSNFDDAVNQILAGNAYANVHTRAFPSGEIRGQLNVQQ